MNLSSLSRIAVFAGVAGLAALSTLWLAYSAASGEMMVYAALTQLVAVGVVLFNVFLLKSFFNRVGGVCDAVRAGDFDQRLVLPGVKGDVRKTAERINALIDVNDAFVREAALALTAASEGRFYRKIRPEGMQGMFLHSVGKINEAIELMAEASMARVKIVEELRAQIGGTIEAALAGDFSKRVHMERQEDEFAAIGKQVNDLVGIVNRGLSETGAVLGALAQQDLSLRVEGNYSGAFLKLKQDTNSVADKLSEVIGRLRQTSNSLRTASGEILEGANDLSERTLKQAATIEQTSATMEELSSAVMQSAAQADDASVKSLELSRTAEQSGKVVKKATDAMERITSSSARISNVIGMIDDIAFQTNLLALNASVEAARAGEAGKGFAVVAVEVRRLAQSAAEASSEVKQLIEQSASEVEQGSRFVIEVSQNLLGMISSIQGNSGLMQGLASSSRKQASSIEEVNTAVRQMDEMTQHNAALVEETNAAIEQTDHQVNELDRVVEVFKLEAGAEEIARSKQEKQRPPRAHSERAGDKMKREQAPQPARTFPTQGSAAIEVQWSEY